jgi:transcriptional regulator with XRE-family HTH domain
MVEQSKKLKLVGEFIKKRREALNISQRALGMFFTPPVTTQFISNVERGVTPLPPIHIPVLAKALSVSDTELMALLEREYAMKLNGRLGKSGEMPGASGSMGLAGGGEMELMKVLMEAYRSADPRAREAFASACENLLHIPKSSFSKI